MSESRYYRQVDRQKQAFDRYYEQRFFEVLMDQLNPIMEGWQFYQVPSDIIRQVEKMSPDALKPTYFDLYRRVGLEFAKNAVESLKGYETDLKQKSEPMTTLLDNPESFTWIWTTQVNEWVLMNVGSRIKTVNETSKKRVIEIIRQITQQSIDEGLTIPETMAMLEDRIPIEWRKERWRAQTIARTEVLTASNEGSFRGAKATGLQLKKKWLTRLDGREREAHRLANGQERELDQPYLIGGQNMMRPGDIRADAANVVNCRCVEQYIRVRPEDN